MATAYLTTSRIAEKLGVNPSKVLGFINSGELRAIDVSHNKGVGRPRWRITPEALSEFELSRSSQPAVKPAPATTSISTPRRRAGRQYV